MESLGPNLNVQLARPEGLATWGSNWAVRVNPRTPESWWKLWVASCCCHYYGKICDIYIYICVYIYMHACTPIIQQSPVLFVAHRWRLTMASGFEPSAGYYHDGVKPQSPIERPSHAGCSKLMVVWLFQDEKIGHKHLDDILGTPWYRKHIYGMYHLVLWIFRSSCSEQLQPWEGILPLWWSQLIFSLCSAWVPSGSIANWSISMNKNGHSTNYITIFNS